MPESAADANQQEQRELEGKNIAHYSVLLSAWIDTRMERDKTLVTLSAAAIGLLITILTTVGVPCLYFIPIYIISVGAFITAIFSALKIYQLNSDHIEASLHGETGDDPKLEKYDKRTIRSFYVGCVTALLIGVLSATYQVMTHEERVMSNQDKPNHNLRGRARFLESINGVTRLNPNSIGKSLNGIQNLKPQATPQGPQQQNSNPAGSASQPKPTSPSSNSKK